MKFIPLTQGKVAIVDDEDFEWLNQWKWFAAPNHKKGKIKWYAKRQGKWIGTVNGVRKREKTIYMHRVIAAHSGFPEVDHKDGDGLNNQRNNLRPCTDSQNQHNRSKDMGTTSRFKGVYWNKYAKKWGAQISANYRKFWLGYFDSELAAAEAYLAASKLHHKDFAHATCLS